jgi:hypothetical protein
VRRRQTGMSQSSTRFVNDSLRSADETIAPRRR